MLNDPYGRLDMRAVVRTLIVLFLTCNFYSFVLVPFDSITHTVTKAISASVDKDPSGLWGKVNDVYSSIEDKTKEETLVGQFDAEMENNKSNATVDALSYETSAVAESLAEATIQEGKKPGFFKRLWAGVKGFVSGKVGMVMNNVGNIISALISVIVKLVQYILLAAGILVCNTLLLEGLIRIGANAFLAKILVEVLMFSVSYVIQHAVIFKRNTAEKQSLIAEGGEGA